MYESMELTQEKVATYDTNVDVAELELGNSKLGIGVIMVMAAFVGIWGVICLISGLANVGSFHEIWHALITAFSGV